MKFSPELAGRFADKRMYATSVKYDPQNKYIVQLNAFHFDGVNPNTSEEASETVYLNRNDILRLLDNGYSLTATLPGQKNGYSQIVKYKHPMDGETYITTLLVSWPCDNLGTLPIIP